MRENSLADGQWLSEDVAETGEASLCEGGLSRFFQPPSGGWQVWAQPGTQWAAPGLTETLLRSVLHGPSQFWPPGTLSEGSKREKEFGTKLRIRHGAADIRNKEWDQPFHQGRALRLLGLGLASWRHQAHNLQPHPSLADLGTAVLCARLRLRAE